MRCKPALVPLERRQFKHLSQSFGLGLLLALGQAPYKLWFLGFLVPGLLGRIWDNLSPRTASLSGLFCGLGYFGLSVSWVFVSIYYYGETPLLVACGLTGLFVTILALFFSLLAYLYRLLPGTGAQQHLWRYPVLWVLSEWLRSFVLTGFPWAFLGMSQIDTVFRKFAPIGSVYLISLLVCGVSSAAYSLVLGQKAEQRQAFCGLIAILLVLNYLPDTWTQPVSKEPLSVALVQGNIAPLDKFAAEDPLGVLEDVYLKMTEAQWATLVVWPEAAISLPWPYVKPYLARIDTKAQQAKSTLISGLPINQNDSHYNGLISLGMSHGVYYKRHLVPFGDYLPYQNLLRGLIGFFDLPLSDQTPGPRQQAHIKTPFGLIAPFICYEIAFPELVREGTTPAGVIVTISEDGWFGRSWGPSQHLDLARMRALETGRMVLRATTSGMTAVIDAHGRLQAQIPSFEQAVLKSEFHTYQGSTPWLNWGLSPGLIICAIVLSWSYHQGMKKCEL